MSKKRDSLIATGERLFIKHGMRRVTVEEICRQAGVSKPTFYSHFENKSELARRIVELWLEEGIKRIDEIQVAQIPFTAKLQQILDVRQEFAVRPGPEFFEDLIRLDIDMSHILESVMGFFTHSQARGDIRGDVPPQVLLAAYNSLNSLQHDTGALQRCRITGNRCFHAFLLRRAADGSQGSWSFQWRRARDER